MCAKCWVRGSPCYDRATPTPFQNADPASRPAHGKSTGCARAGGVSYKTKGNVVLRGDPGQHRSYCSRQDPNPPRAEAARRGAGRQALLEHRHRFMYSYIQHNFLSTTKGCSPAGKTNPRQTDSFCVVDRRDHECRNSKKRGPYIDGPFILSPLSVPLATIHPSADTTTARPGPVPWGQPHPWSSKPGRKEGHLSDLCDVASGKGWAVECRDSRA